MFRHRHRPAAPFADFINWTDYRWEPNAWQGATQPRPWADHTKPRPGYSFLQVFLAGLAVVVALKLMASLRNSRNRSWLERAVLTVLALAIASYVSKRRRRL